jgi:hypothetical protein
MALKYLCRNESSKFCSVTKSLFYEFGEKIWLPLNDFFKWGYTSHAHGFKFTDFVVPEAVRLKAFVLGLLVGHAVEVAEFLGSFQLLVVAVVEAGLVLLRLARGCRLAVVSLHSTVVVVAAVVVELQIVAAVEEELQTVAAVEEPAEPVHGQTVAFVHRTVAVAVLQTAAVAVLQTAAVVDLQTAASAARTVEPDQIAVEVELLQTVVQVDGSSAHHEVAGRSFLVLDRVETDSASLKNTN